MVGGWPIAAVRIDHPHFGARLRVLTQESCERAFAVALMEDVAADDQVEAAVSYAINFAGARCSSASQLPSGLRSD